MSLLQQELERAFGDGPAHRPIEETLRSGRRALRRRRLGAVAGALAVLATIGTGYAVTTAGTDPRTSGEMATDPSPSPSRTAKPEPTNRPWGRGETARYAGDGQLEIRPGVKVHEHIENPYDYQPPETSDAFDLTYDGQRTWVILEIGKDGSGTTSSSEPSHGWASFADFVADQVDLTTGGDGGWPETVRMTGDDLVVAGPGSEILQRTDDPRLGDSFAPPGATTGAALVRAAEDGLDYFVVWRVIDGELDVITTPPDVFGTTFPELLSHARGQYANGEGLR